MAFELKIECLGNLEPQISKISVIIQEKDWVLLTWDISIERSVTEIFRDDNFVAVATGNSKNITNLQPGKRYKVSLLPHHNKIKGDFVTFDLEMSPDPPKIHIFEVGTTSFQGFLDTKSDCQSVEIIITSAENRLNLNCETQEYSDFEFSFGNLESGKLYNLTVTVFMKTQSVSSSKMVCTKAEKVEILDQRFLGNNTETYFKLLLPGSGSAFEYWTENEALRSPSQTLPFDKYIDLAIGSENAPGSVLSLRIIAEDGSFGELVSITIGVAILSDLEFYETELDSNLYLKYRFTGSITAVEILADDVFWPKLICNANENPCMFEHFTPGKLNSIEVRAQYKEIKGKWLQMKYAARPNVNWTLSEDNVLFLSKEGSTMIDFTFSFSYEGEFNQIEIEIKETDAISIGAASYYVDKRESFWISLKIFDVYTCPRVQD